MKRLREVAALHSVPVEPLEALLSALEAEADPPTRVGNPVDEHIADSLSALPFLGSPSRVADIGSGAGFPALPLAAGLPEAAFVLFESQRRHAAVAQRLVSAASLSNVRVLKLRIEAWDERECFDLVTVRAVASLAVLVEYAAPVLAPGGVLVAWKGARDEAEERAGEEAARQVGLSVDRVAPVKPWPEAHSRHLHFYAKTGITPDRFPRRAGMARKRPLAV